MEYREKQTDKTGENRDESQERKGPSEMSTKRSKIALVTGATSGMGKEFVREISA